MCLIKKHKIPKLCIFPKTVYKIVNKNNDGKFITPYMGYPIKIGKTYTGEFNNRRTLFDTINKDCVEDGFIHSFKSLCETIIERNSTWPISSYVIIKCKIPAFTYYYEGEYEEIASRRLKYIELIG